MNSDRNHWIGLAALVVGGLGFLWPTYPVNLCRQMKLLNRYPYLMSLPAVAVFAVYFIILGRSVWMQDSMVGRYRSLAKTAIDKADFDIARTYYERLIQIGKKREPEDELNLALACFRSGDVDAAQLLFDRLAPDDGVGYPKTHRLKAMQLVAVLAAENPSQQAAESQVADGPLVSQSTWELVRTHLIRSGLDDPIELADLWTAYYLASGKTVEAIA